MEKIYRAGIVPFFVDNSKVYMLFMKPSDPKYGGEHFQIAKGKREADEEDETAALREGFEELGLLEENIEQIIDAGNFLGRTKIFLARVRDKEKFGQFHFETAETKWLTAQEFEEIGRDIHRHVVRAIAKLIQ